MSEPLFPKEFTADGLTFQTIDCTSFTYPPEFIVRCAVPLNGYLAVFVAAERWLLQVDRRSTLGVDSTVHRTLAAWFAAATASLPVPKVELPRHMIAQWRKAKPLPKGRRRKLTAIEDSSPMFDDPLLDIGTEMYAPISPAGQERR